MKWNEKVAVFLRISGGICAIVGAMLSVIFAIPIGSTSEMGIHNTFYIGGKFIVVGFVLVWSGVAFSQRNPYKFMR